MNRFANRVLSARYFHAPIICCLLNLTANAADTTHKHTSPYAGEEARQIKSLSQSDIKALQAGSGWGLAKAAELNGVPGPVHLLEMQEHISLTADQIESIEAIFANMKKEATRLGQVLIEQETDLDEMFRSGVPSSDKLESLVYAIGKTRSALRYTHLHAHLKTPKILTAQQLEMYINIRGYAANDPCGSVPDGHDSIMWKKHNNCI